MNVSFETPKPEIRVYWDERTIDDRLVQEVLLGIEEEGVPYYKAGKTDVDNAVILAYKAAEASHLGVGIGISKDEIALHYIKLPEDKPLFHVGLGGKSERLRAVGSNAARLVKRMPFKDLD